jgi:hypothetical protein
VSGDFNGDGVPDLAVADASQGANRIVLLTQQPGAAGSFRAPVDIVTPAASVALARADVDDDRRDDLIVWLASRTAGSTTGSGQFGYLLQLPGGGMGPFVPVATRTGLNGARRCGR